MRRALIALLLSIAALPLSAGQPAISPTHRELVEKLLKVTNSDQIEMTVLDAFFAQVQQSFLKDAEAKGNSEAQLAEANELFDAVRRKAGQVDIAGLIHEETVRLYARYFTEEEVAGLVAFYESPLGMKTIKALPELMRESMQMGSDIVGPKIEEAVQQAIDEHERKRPWRAVMKDMRSVATATEAWAIDHDDRYPIGDYVALKELLSPDYIREFPEKDVWGNRYEYIVSPDGSHYRLVSSGSDANFDWDSRQIANPVADETIYREGLEADIVYQDGSFVQLPKQSKEN